MRNIIIIEDIYLFYSLDLKVRYTWLYFDIIPVFWDIKGTDNQMWYFDSSIMTTPRYFTLFLFFFTFSRQQYRPGMIILTMQLQRIVAKMLGNLKRINLLLSCLCKKSFVMTTVIAMLKYASIVWATWQQTITEFVPNSPEQPRWLSTELSLFFIEAYFIM